ncbi:MAG: hypothetical protein K2U26_08470 [Cyclobacteriaceae bacterium]|nr:hypothetical protein [Cyclobacteriaceae bacterium]
MIQLIFLIVASVGVLIMILHLFKKASEQFSWSDLKKHAILLLLGWAGFAAMLGLMSIFDDLEASQQTLVALRHGTSVALFTWTSGLLVFCAFLFPLGRERA